MKPKLLTLMGIVLYQLVGAQIISIDNGASISLDAGTVLHADNLVLQPSASFSLTGPNTLSRNATVTNSTANPYISRVYRLTNTVSSFNGTITIYYDDAELNNIVESELTLNVHNGTNWTAYNTGITRDGTLNFVTTTGITGASLNELTLAGQFKALPLLWLGIEAVQAGDNNLITWRTADEVNVKHFQLQKSPDGVTWTNEGNTLPAANTSGTHSYSYTDHSRYTPITYYRVRQDDVDGRSSYSPIVSVKLSTQHSLLLMPNPATSQLQIKSTVHPITAVVIYNAAGSTVYVSDRIQQNSMTIPVANWPAGYYSVQLTINGRRVVSGFIKL